MSGEEMRERLAEADTSRLAMTMRLADTVHDVLAESPSQCLGEDDEDAPCWTVAVALLPVVRAIVAEELDGVLDDVQRRVQDAPDASAALAGIALDVLNRKEAADR